MLWLGVVACVLFYVVMMLLMAELRGMRNTLAQLLGSIADSNWRIRDELAALNKKLETSQLDPR